MIKEQRLQEIRGQQASVRSLRREIGLVDQTSGRTYLRDFAQDYDRFQERASYDDLIVRGFRSDIIYIGDYHALPACQVFCTRFLKDMIRRSAHVVLGLEMIYGRQQRLLDDWMARRFNDEEFLRRIRYQQEWGYDWSSYGAILRTDADVFSEVDELRWRGPTSDFGALCEELGASGLAERVARLAP